MSQNYSCLDTYYKGSTIIFVIGCIVLCQLFQSLLRAVVDPGFFKGGFSFTKTPAQFELKTKKKRL